MGAMLEGLRIVEFEGLGPGPFAGMWLADQGAEVVVIQRPGGPPLPGLPDANLLDRGKRTIALDLKSPEDLRIVRALVARAHGLIEGYRPGVMERLGLGPDDLRALNPALVYGRITGWGQTGPRAKQAGHDLNYIALSGALHYAGNPGEAPFTPPTLVGDIGGGALYLVAGMLAALWRARATGQGAVVDAAIVDGSAHMLALVMSMQAAGMFRAERGRSILDGPHWARSYACADGFIAVQCLEAKFYAEFLDRMGLSADPRFARQFDPATWGPATAALAAIFATQTRAHWATVFHGSDGCAAPVLSPAEAAADPHLAARATWATGAALQPRAAPRYDGATPPEPPAPRPRDADRAAILDELGLRPPNP
jgi:crotonobetainyl-CoA:carnitine CoA-transferase CaiB-like acyl-CoA transferase